MPRRPLARPELEGPRGQPERRVGRSDDQAAGPEMLAHHSGEQALRSCVERGRGLVEQPQRPPRDEQPRERDSPLLARRQRAHRKIGDMGEAEPPERRRAKPRGADRLRERPPRTPDSPPR